MEALRDLKNKPLVEALLEVRWALEGPPGIAVDPAYQLLIGQLYGKLRGKFPHHVTLPSAELPPQFVPFTPQHQFRVAPDQWPLVQLGPGLLTINDTEGYIWDDFYDYCAFVVSSFFEAYPDHEKKLRIAEVTLRYIDADLLHTDSVLDFLNKLKISIEIQRSLFQGSPIGSTPLGVGLSLTYPIESPKSVLQLTINKGQKKGSDALVWETHVISRGDDSPQASGEITEWLRKAHIITHDWFMRQIDGDLLERYR